MESETFKEYFDVFDNILTLKKDKITIDENIFIPENYVVKIFEGQKINLINNAFIFQVHPGKQLEKKDKEILIGGNKNNFGGGIIIKETKDRSNFEYVKFQFLNGLKKAFIVNKIKFCIHLKLII